MVEVITMLTTGTKVAWWAVKRLHAYEEERTEALRRGYQAAKDDWQRERSRRIEERLDQLEDTQEHRAAFERLLTEEFFFIQQNIEIEAFREATKERRRMLAFAAAGIFRLDFTVEGLARIERALRGLEPRDIDRLQTIVREGDTHALSNHAFKVLQPESLEGASLVAVGCVGLQFGGFGHGHAHVTDLGRNVLTVLDGYLRARQPDAPTPPQRNE